MFADDEKEVHFPSGYTGETQSVKNEIACPNSFCY